MNKTKSARLIVILENKVLLVHNFLNPNNIFYYFPGGHLDKGETYEEAALREIREELDLPDLKVDSLEEVHRQTFEKKDGEIKEEVFFKATISHPTLDSADDLIKQTHGTNDPDHGGTDELVWIEVDQLSQDIRPPEVTRLIKDL